MLGQKFQFFIKNGLFLLQNVFESDFFNHIRNQRLGIDTCTKFQLHWTKDKGTRVLTWNDTKNGLMTSYLPPGDDISKIFMAFERFCPRVLSCQAVLVIEPQIKEKQRGAECAAPHPRPAYMVPKDPSLNRVNLLIRELDNCSLGGRFLSLVPCQKLSI